MTPYADTNFFTRVYLQLTESEEADRLLRKGAESGASPLPLTWLHRIAIVNALQLQVLQSREARQSYISDREAALAHAAFLEDVQTGSFLRSSAIPHQELEKQSEGLALRRTARFGFRTYDVIHVASA